MVFADNDTESLQSMAGKRQDSKTNLCMQGYTRKDKIVLKRYSGLSLRDEKEITLGKYIEISVPTANLMRPQKNAISRSCATCCACRT